MTAGMYNDGRYPVVAAFSCSVGKFDEPGTASLSEALVTAPGVGAIAVISATRETYAPANEELSIDFYHFLLDSASTRTIGMSLAAVFVGKPNLDRSYAILGDPSIRAVRATRKVTLTIDDPDDTLAALQEVVVSGTITVNGKIDREFDGDAYVAIGLFNPPDTVSRKDGGDRQQVRYALPGNPVFLGKTKLVMGKFSQKLLVPQKLSFHRPGSKLTAYAWKEGSADAGAGCRRDLVFGGSVASSKSKDTEGPRISIRPVYEDSYLSGREASFTDRITTQPPVKCEIELHDPSGIDVAGNGPDEGVTVAIEGVVARQNVNNKFRFREGDFRRGVVSLEYGELKPGKHVMTVTARDLFGNLSKARFTVVVTDKEQLRLDHVLNFPNPMRMGTVTRFYCHTNYTARQTYGNDVRLTVRIYSLGGKLLRVIDDGEHPGSRVHNGIEWDGRDERGHPLGPDVYLYRITAVDRGPNGRKVSRSRIMKLVILPPR